MVEKPLTVLAYLVLGLFVILLPLLFKGGLAGRSKSYPYLTLIIVAGIAAFVAKIDAVGNHRLALSWFICAGIAALTVWKKWPPVTIGVTIGLAIASIMPWWRYNGFFIDASRHDLTICAVITLTILVFLLQEFIAPEAIGRRWRIGPVAAFMPAALYLCFTTGMAENWQTFGSWWHHWGAYIGPVELLLSGAHVLKDFPVQYGMGPTLLIAAVTRDNCWVAMYEVVAVSTALWSLLIVYTATTLGVRSRAALIALVPISVCACFFWTSYGAAFSSPLLFPSVAGLRFTPVVALVAALCFCEGTQRNWKLAGHIVWAIGALWSPESLYLVSFVWWPYYCWRMIAGLQGKRMVFALVKSLTKLVFVLLLTLAAFLAVYALVYHELPSVTAWFAYLLFPPAFVPLNPRGLIWWYGAVLVLGVAALAQTYRTGGDTARFRRSFLVLLMGYAVLSYCMGRSIDNNFANLAPCAMLILIGVFASSLPVLFRAIAAAMLASLVGLLPLFGWGIWHDDYKAGRLFEFAPEKVTASFAFTDATSAAKLRQTFIAQKIDVGDPGDAARAITEITKRSHEQVTVLDHASVVVEGGPRNAWDGFHSAVIYAYLPQEWRTKFLVATAQRLHKSGWVIAEKKFDAAPWLASYKAAYDLVGEEDYGTYHAYHFVPKVAAQ